MSTTNNTSVRVTRGDLLLRMVKKSKTFVKPKPLALKRSLRLQTKSSKRKPSAAKHNNIASVNNIAKTIQALENLKTPASKSKNNNNVFALNFGRNGAPVVMSQKTSSTARRVSSRERKAPKRYGFNNNKSKP